jgi:hypothetical protein
MKTTILLLFALLLSFTNVFAQCDGTTSAKANFNHHVITAGNKVWYSAQLKILGNNATYPVTIHFTNQVINSTAFNFNVPDAELIIDPSVTTATTTFTGTKWVTRVQPNSSNQYFFSGYIDSVTTNIPAGLHNVTWSGKFTATQPNIALSWKWAAAVYSTLHPVWNHLGIKPSDCTNCSSFFNNDDAGTPENYKSYVVSGATGNGNSFTGAHSNTEIVRPCVSVMPTVMVNASATAICQGSSVTFTAAGTNLGSAPAYQWMKNGVSVGANSATYTTSSLNNNDSVWVVITSSNSLAVPATVVSNKVVITINPLPSSISLSGDTVICANATATLTASVAGGVWSSSNNAVATVSATGVVTAVATGNTTIKYTVTTPCGNVTVSKNIRVAKSFTVSEEITSPTCFGYTDGSIVTNVSCGCPSIYNYSWSNGANTFGIWGVPAGTYTVDITNAEGCMQRYTYNVTQPAEMVGYASVTDVSAPGATDGAIDYTVTGGTSPYSYHWCYGQTTEDLHGIAAGPYFVTTTDAKGCQVTNYYNVATATYLQSITSSIESHGSGTPGGNGKMLPGNNYADYGVILDLPADAVSTYPNPFATETNISFTIPENGHTVITVINPVNGQQIATLYNGETQAGRKYNCTFSAGNLATGTYIYHLSSGNYRTIGKLQISK